MRGMVAISSALVYGRSAGSTSHGRVAFCSWRMRSAVASAVASALPSSLFIAATTMPCEGSILAFSLSAGMRAMQGPHQEAQKSSSRAFPLPSWSLSVVASPIEVVSGIFKSMTSAAIFASR